MRITILMPYFGAWPAWGDYYLETCRFNAGIEWVFLTDGARPRNQPPNVRFVEMTLEAFNRLATMKLGIPVAVQTPYKICDARPAFGVIFADYLAGVDFWGHSDVDMMYGDIARFITPDVLAAWDVITPYTVSCGHFQLYRNREPVNSLFRRRDDYERAFTAAQYELFDHIKFNEVLAAAKDVRWWRVDSYHDELVKPQCRVGATIAENGAISYEQRTGCEIYLWSEGRTFQQNLGRTREFPYLHFMGWKHNTAWKGMRMNSPWTAAPAGWFISEQGIRKAGRSARWLIARHPGIIGAWQRLARQVKSGANALATGLRLPGRLDEFRRRDIGPSERCALFVRRLPARARLVAAAVGKRGKLGWLNSLRLLLLEKNIRHEDVAIRPPGLRHPVLIRSGTTDLQVFDHIFLDCIYDIPVESPPRFILDCGANTGLSAVYFACRYPEAEIMAIEPEASNFATLVDNTRYYRNIRPLRAGVWGQDARLKVVRRSEEWSGEWDCRVETAGPEDADVVPAVTLKGLLESGGHQAIDLLKMDVEGAEKEIFSAPVEDWLGRVGMIVIELHDGYRPGCSEAFYAAVKAFPFTESRRGECVVLKREAAKSV